LDHGAGGQHGALERVPGGHSATQIQTQLFLVEGDAQLNIAESWKVVYPQLRDTRMLGAVHRTPTKLLDQGDSFQHARRGAHLPRFGCGEIHTSPVVSPAKAAQAVRQPSSRLDVAKGATCPNTSNGSASQG